MGAILACRFRRRDLALGERVPHHAVDSHHPSMSESHERVKELFLSTGATSFAPGDVFAGRYRMITQIGRGGAGAVWRADDLVLEMAVALKLIGSTGSETRARILKEVRLAREITHPAVCRVFDVGEADGGIFYSMELVPGEDLAGL